MHLKFQADFVYISHSLWPNGLTTNCNCIRIVLPGVCPIESYSQYPKRQKRAQAFGAQRVLNVWFERVTRGATTFTHWNMVGNSTQIRFFFSLFLASKRNKIFRIPNTETIQFACGIEFEWMLNAKANANARRRRRDGILIEMWIEWNQAKSRSVTKCDKTKRKNIEILYLHKAAFSKVTFHPPSNRTTLPKKNNVIKQTKTATQTEK